MPHTVFNLDEVADYLHIAKTDVTELVKQQQIPFEQAGERLVFRKGDIDAWASQRILGLPKGELTDLHKTSSDKAVQLSDNHAIIPDLMKADYIEPRLLSKTKAGVIRDMMSMADQTGLVNYPADLLARIQEREQMCSTALAGGLALLHPRHHDPYLFEDSFVTLARTPQSVPFGSPDGGTTDLFFLICCQNDKLHLHVLARICMICYHTSSLYDLREAKTAEDMLESLLKGEEEVIKGL